jgi:hypothetical protein
MSGCTYSSEWREGRRAAECHVNTAGPERAWDVEMRVCRNVADGKEYDVVYDPFADRLMWFDNMYAAAQAFSHLVALASFDADGVENNRKVEK